MFSHCKRKNHLISTIISIMIHQLYKNRYTETKVFSIKTFYSIGHCLEFNRLQNYQEFHRSEIIDLPLLA